MPESEKYFEVRFRLPGGWLLVNRFNADNFVEAATKARKSINDSGAGELVTHIGAECAELDNATGRLL
jgi:hypothetical protein